MGRSRAARGDRGFTLVELLVSITIMGILSTVIVSAVAVSLKVTKTTAESLTSTARRTVLTGRLLEDVRDSAALGIWDTAGGAWVTEPPASCAGPAHDAGDPPPVPFLWAEIGSTTVAYWQLPAPTSHDITKIYRLTCGSADGSAPLAGWSISSAHIHVVCGDSDLDSTSLAGCGLLPTATLVNRLPAADEPDHPAGSVPISDVTGANANTFPASTSFPLYIGDETMIASVSGASLTLTRGNPVEHAAGESVVYGPRVVRIRIPIDPVANGDQDHYDLVIARRAT